MASTYTNSLTLTEIGTGDQAGTWGTTTNTNIQLIEDAIAGAATITSYIGGNAYTLTQVNGSTDVQRKVTLIFAGTPSGAVTVTAPLVPKWYIIANNTSYQITMSATGGGVNLVIPAGVTAQCYCDGVNGFYSAQTGSAGNFTINGNLIVSGNIAETSNLSVTGTTTLSGVATAPTPTAGDNSTKIATTAFVTNATGTLGTMSTQNANSVTITGGTINGTTIGGSTAAAGTFTTLGGTTITASTQFSGPGTGLTGTASSLSIGGNAATTSQTNFSNLTIGSSQVLYAGNYNSYSPTLTGTGASGTWSINITGNAVTTSQTNFSNLTISSSQVLYAGNYNSYSPTLTGGGASGTWGINITGNAATATTATNATNATNATQVVMTDFSIKEVSGKIYFYYGTTQIASIDSSGNFISLANITGYGTP